MASLELVTNCRLTREVVYLQGLVGYNLMASIIEWLSL